MPKKEIVIDGIIGWDITGRQVRRELDQAEDAEVLISLASPGGFVFDGLEIFNIIRDYSRKQNTVTIKLYGLAASMASYIALAGDKLIMEDNAVFMIHNAWGLSIGDYRDMQKDAVFFESISNLLAQKYVEKSGKKMKEIRDLMDAETWYFGGEAKDAGFVDEIIKAKKTENENASTKTEIIALQKGRVKDTFDKMQQSEKSKKDLERAAALIPQAPKTPDKQEAESPIPADTAVKKQTEEKNMTLDDFLAENSKIRIEYDKRIHAAQEDGGKKLQAKVDRVTTILGKEEYKGIEPMAYKVLKNEVSIDAFEGAIGFIDMQAEKEKSEQAKKETEEIGDTKPESKSLSKDGEINNLADIKAEKARIKGVA